MKTVLLTGAAGFIGWKTAEFLLKEGYKVIGVDNLNNYYDVRLKEYRKKDLEKYENFKFYPVDIENLQALEILFNDYKFDVVINLAARAGVRYSMINPYVYMTTNANGTLNLLDLMKKYSVKKFVLASTSSLYAGQPMPFKEDLPVNTPISPYAASKKAAEVMAYTYHYLYGIDVSVVRYFTVYGPAGRPDMSIFRFIKWIDEGKPIILYGDGSQSRDFTYVDDIARGTILATKELGYEIINLGGGKNPISLKRVIETIEAHLGKKAVIDYRPFHKADLKETWADITKAKNLLGWEPKVSFEEGIKKTVDWYLENRDWLKDVEVGNE
ncbi:NAD-dependent epimerase/dehydratase [Sulfurihydrogenibium sp. YO3AOP1]|uniref:SDR family NAD(P)-dependent oxidoreductase n=1 Tax=Sulfurihydrogenibium sp. (strain YO3AOP1) TaxID=436114 RepID=UPI000172368C|nr:SDR family NAD(P)-dependent oxidoreductase [Sulfurihydrogenibium sp. YO3AOP1]ACD65809.1 NAD-dependent epimerase/dehydratase [Sulfurihydrogenibium sp. YO3AOP1]